MVTALTETRPDLKLRKILGQSYLHENRLKEALEIYTRILREFPRDFDALVTLGNLYLAIGSGKTAERLYEQALESDPDNRVVRKQIELARVENAAAEETDPLSAEAVTRLHQKLTGEQPLTFSDAALERAAAIYQFVKESTAPAEEVSVYLDEIDELMPALLELNIRQARMDGQAELAETLQALQRSVQQQAPATARENDIARADWKVCLLNPEPGSRRIVALETMLRRAGCSVFHSSDSAIQPDVVIAGSPHIQPGLLERLAQYAAAHVPVIVDLDVDYENMPLSHPDYTVKGLGSPQASRAYTAALFLASAITVPGDAFAATLRSANRSVTCIPDGWNRANPLWETPGKHKRGITIGWTAGETGAEDIALIKRVLIRVLREFPQTRLAIIGSQPAYQLFQGAVPADRLLYLPYLSEEDYPALLNGVDIAIAPARSHPFHQAMSDRVVCEAGIKRIAWVASPVPAYEQWQAGGLIARSLDEWHAHLRQLITDNDVRITLGRDGYMKAREREFHNIARQWLACIATTIEQSHQRPAAKRAL